MAAFNVNFVGTGNVAERLVTGTGGQNLGNSTLTAGTITLPTNRVVRITGVISNYAGAGGYVRLRNTSLTGTLILSLFFAVAGQIIIENSTNPLVVVSGATAAVIVVTEAGSATANEITIVGKID